MKRPKQEPLGFLPINALPGEMLAEILKRLPVKYILRCMVVQKSWYNLVKTPVFITLHFNYQKITTHDRPKYLFFRNNKANALSVRFDDEQCQEYCNIRHIPPLQNISPDNIVLCAVSDGLICVAVAPQNVNTRKIYVWNPLIQKYKTLPDLPVPFGPRNPEDTCEALAFGFLQEVNNYVVVHVYKPYLHHSVTIRVYSLNTNSSKKTSHNCAWDWNRTNDAVFVNGAAFWLGTRSDYINIVMCFDTKTEILREIVLPEWMINCRASRVIHPFGQSLAYFVHNYENHFEMGVLQGDPINEYSWEKKMSVSTKKYVKPAVLGLRNNGEPILIYSGFFFKEFMSYNLDSHEASDFLKLWDHCNDYSYNRRIRGPPFVISPFVESLVFLDI